MKSQSAAPARAAEWDASIIAPAPIGKVAAYLWRRRYDDLDNAGIAAALREWAAWRLQQTITHPDDADAITDCFIGLTAWLRAEAQRRLSRPATIGRRLTTADLVAGYGDRLQPAGADRWRCICPWHADSRPSLIVYADGWAHCFACGEHRPVADLAARWQAVAA